MPPNDDRLVRLESKMDDVTDRIQAVSTDLAVLNAQLLHILQLETRIQKVEAWMFRGLGAVSILSIVVGLAARAWL